MIRKLLIIIYRLLKRVLRVIFSNRKSGLQNFNILRFQEQYISAILKNLLQFKNSVHYVVIMKPTHYWYSQHQYQADNTTIVTDII